MKEVMISKNAWEGKVKGRGPDDLQGDKFGGSTRSSMPPFGSLSLGVES
jgi:hypothetical protein